MILTCLANGTLVTAMDIPTCVPPTSCKFSQFPTHPEYLVHNPDILFYNHGESIGNYYNWTISKFHSYFFLKLLALL